MKRLILFLILIISITLTGCIHETNITEEESDAVAEYMAGLLLKYDDKYDKALIPKDEIGIDSKTNNVDVGSNDNITK
jgi:hypothetical protein